MTEAIAQDIASSLNVIWVALGIIIGLLSMLVVRRYKND